MTKEYAKKIADSFKHKKGVRVIRVPRISGLKLKFKKYTLKQIREISKK
jgi:hypothetical protein